MKKIVNYDQDNAFAYAGFIAAIILFVLWAKMLLW